MIKWLKARLAARQQADSDHISWARDLNRSTGLPPGWSQDPYDGFPYPPTR